MLVQSGGGKVYAILADTKEREVGLAVKTMILHNSVFMSLRIRYKARDGKITKMDMPKRMLTGDTESSPDTFRTLLAIPTGVHPEKVTKTFGEEWARKIQNASGGVILEEGGFLEKINIRSDFIKDMGEVIMKSLGAMYPPKYLGASPSVFLYTEDANDWIKANISDGVDKLVEVVEDTDGVVLKHNFGVDKTPTKH